MFKKYFIRDQRNLKGSHTWVVGLTLAKNEKMSPSEAIEYMHLGNENKDPKSVVVMPQSAPIEMAY